jgi:hypothetical protein
VKIKSQKSLYSSHFSIGSIFRSFKAAPFFGFLAIVIIFSVLSIVMIYVGSVLEKNRYMATIQQQLYNAAETKFSVFNNYISGLQSSPDQLYFDVKFEDIQLLNYARGSALSRGYITQEEQDITVKARLSIGNSQYKVELSPTGQNLDMIGSINKRAYKVKVLEGKKIYGMEEFKLLPPITRHHVVEWVGHALEDKEGLISLRYFFVEVALNGNDLGVYAIEEHFNKELLENRKAREGIIFKEIRMDNEIFIKPIKIFNEKKISKDPISLNRIRLLKSALQSVKNNEIEIGRIFDLKKFATQFAIIDLMDGYHVLGSNNAIYFFNPVTNLIEPITREYNSLRYSERFIYGDELMIDRFRRGGKYFSNKLFENNEFTAQYLIQLSKLSDQKYLDEFFEDVDEALSIQTNILYRDDPFYKFPKELMYKRQKEIKTWLNQDLNIVANVDEDNLALYKIKFRNNSPFPIELLKIFSSEQNLDSILNNVVYPGKEMSLSIALEPNVTINDLNFSYKIYGIDNLVREAIVVPKSFSTGVSLSELWNTSSDYLLNNGDVIVDQMKKTISFDQQVVNLTKDLFIPENFIVMGKPGLTINLQEGASIYSKSAFNFNGSVTNPIKITSLDQLGGGLVIIGPKKESVFINTTFEHLTSPNIGSSGLTASISVYKTDVSFQNCIFDQNESEDFLNLIHSKYEIIDSYFKSAQSDAVDSDYSNGTIINSIFTDIGNDAIDFSGSISELSELSFNGIGDKALSAGEMSKISGKNIDIINAEIGITSKDLSEVTLNDVNIKDTRLGFAVFQKKEEYGAGTAQINGLEMINVELSHLVDLNSTLTLNGQDVISKRSKVGDLLYGANFGKSSK